MVRFERARDGGVYVVKIPREITVDDPVGAYILKWAEANPKGRTRFNAKQVRYTDLLEDFENGNMPKEYYDEIMGRIGHLKKPLAQIRDEKLLKSKSIEMKGLLKELFGNLNRLSEQQRKEITSRLGDYGDFKGYVRDYMEERVDQLPDEFKKHKNNARTQSQKGNLKGLEKTLVTLRNVLGFQVKYHHGDFLNWYSNKALAGRYRHASTSGSIFQLIAIVREITEEHNRRST